MPDLLFCCRCAVVLSFVRCCPSSQLLLCNGAVVDDSFFVGVWSNSSKKFDIYFEGKDSFRSEIRWKLWKIHSSGEEVEIASGGDENASGGFGGWDKNIVYTQEPIYGEPTRIYRWSLYGRVVLQTNDTRGNVESVYEDNDDTNDKTDDSIIF